MSPGHLIATRDERAFGISQTLKSERLRRPAPPIHGDATRPNPSITTDVDI